MCGKNLNTQFSNANGDNMIRSLFVANNELDEEKSRLIIEGSNFTSSMLSADMDLIYFETNPLGTMTKKTEKNMARKDKKK